MLWLIWSISLLLSAVSLAVMLCLILRRVLRQRRARADTEARRSVLKALIAFSQHRNREELRPILLSVPVHVALEASFEFLSLLRGEEFKEVVATLLECGLHNHAGAQLERGNEAERIHAAEMLAAFDSAMVVPALLKALDKDRSREVRIAAAISLCDLGTLPPLEIALASIGIAGQRSRRLVDLFRRFPTDRVDELLDYAKGANVPAYVKACAIDALARTSGLQLSRFFLLAVQDSSPDVAAAAIRALGRIGHPNMPSILADAMCSGAWAVRSEAAEAAGRLGLAQLIPTLTALLDDETWPVRYAAAKAMRAILPQGELMLHKIASSQTSRSQRTASLALSEGPAA